MVHIDCQSVACVVVALTLWARTVVAQPSSARQPVELWGAISALGDAPTGRLTSTYAPPLLPAGDFSSRGGQTLTLDPHRALGFDAGVNIFPSRHIGLQIAASRTSADLAGTNGPYAFEFTYVSRQPPDSTPQTFTIQQSIPWPDTTGSISVVTASLNGIVCVGPADHVHATGSAGVSYGRISGTARALGYTTFRMGGRAVLFSDEYHLEVALGAASTVGFNAGGDINMPVHRRTAVLIGYRYFAAPSLEVPVRVSSILNAGEVANEEAVASVSARFPLDPVRLDVLGSRVLAGVKVVF